MSTHSYEVEQCRQCGCHDNMACTHIDYGACWWVEAATASQGPLCSHCQLESEGEIQADEVERHWQQNNQMGYDSAAHLASEQGEIIDSGGNENPFTDDKLCCCEGGNWPCGACED